MPKNGGDWPTVDDMVQKNQRLLVFTSVKSKEASEGIAYNWNYVLENQCELIVLIFSVIFVITSVNLSKITVFVRSFYNLIYEILAGAMQNKAILCDVDGTADGDDGMIAGSCKNRDESPALSTKTISLVLENYFPDYPNSTKACLDNSVPLTQMINTCLQQNAKQWPNFIAVDYYQRSDGGGASKAVNIANGHLTCGCDNIAYCKVNASFGSCNVLVLAPPPPAALPSSTPPETKSNSAGHPTLQRWLYGSLFTIIFLSYL
ncbi:PI-PLC X domain-containing protein At5g67130-like [Silene latifolia]|uniref:PI-PLC X domain-containing protein At5g67130-like n=1 Tax=Silene latifolia TaxID=37657 RepID=UPI003D770418